jgi:hypothetical protein
MPKLCQNILAKEKAPFLGHNCHMVEMRGE